MDLRPEFIDLSKPNDLLALKKHLSEMADELDILYSTTAPNGAISARQGRICLYNNGGVYQLWVNKDGASAWQRLADFDANVVSIASPAQGDVIYYNGTSWVKLSAGTSGYFFKTQGTGANPLWDQLLGLPTSPAQGDIVYYNGTAWVSLVAGTSGQFLKTLGAGANPVWGNALVLKSVTTISAANNSGDITIEDANIYKVIIVLTDFSADDTIALVFDSNGGSDYVNVSGGAVTSITLAQVDTSITGKEIFTAEFLIDNNINVGTNRTRVVGNALSYNNAGTLTFSNIGGDYQEAANPTTFEIFTTGSANMTGKVYLYKMPLS